MAHPTKPSIAVCYVFFQQQLHNPSYFPRNIEEALLPLYNFIVSHFNVFGWESPSLIVSRFNAFGGESPSQRILPLSAYIISCFSKNTTLTAMPIECAIIERYSVLYDLMFEAEYVQKDVDDEALVSDRDGEGSDFLIGKKFSASFDLDEEYQDYLNQKTLL